MSYLLIAFAVIVSLLALRALLRAALLDLRHDEEL